MKTKSTKPRGLLARIKASPYVLRIENTGRLHQSALRNDWWCYLRPPYFGPDADCTCIHESTLAQVLNKLQRVHLDSRRERPAIGESDADSGARLEVEP